MLAYAPRRETAPVRPALIVAIIGGHLAVIAAVMAARMEVLPPGLVPPIFVEQIDAPLPPPPEPRPDPRPSADPQRQTVTRTDPLVPTPTDSPPLDTRSADTPRPEDMAGTGTIPAPPDPVPPLVRTGPRFATADHLVRPPYPDSMRASEREAVLRLRLAIDAAGRVTAVEAVGAADPTFLAAARRHILKAWRYTPATEGGRAVPSSVTVTLKFELASA